MHEWEIESTNGPLIRHLAERWSSEFILPLQSRKFNRVTTQLDAIEHLVLLDLLGSENAIVQSYYPSTAWLFDGLSAAEHRMGLLGLFNEAMGSNAEGGEWHPWNSFFKPRTSYEHQWGGIQDDHIPFVQRGVNILHVIANPFPKVWHTIKVVNSKKPKRLTDKASTRMMQVRFTSQL